MQLTLGTNTDVKLFLNITIRHTRARVSGEEGVVVLLCHDDSVRLVWSYRDLYLQVLEGADIYKCIVLILT